MVNSLPKMSLCHWRCWHRHFALSSNHFLVKKYSRWADNTSKILARIHKREGDTYTHTKHVLLMALFSTEHIYSILHLSFFVCCYCCYNVRIFCHFASHLKLYLTIPSIESNAIHRTNCIHLARNHIFFFSFILCSFDGVWVIETYMGKRQVKF